MYEAHWRLTRRPFDDVASAEFYFAGRSPQAGLLKLRYAIEQRKGCALLVSEHGLGKTFLTHVLEAELLAEGRARFVRLSFPQLSATQTLSYLAQRVGARIPPQAAEHVVLAGLENHLEQLRSQGEHIVFLIDDAHLLELPHLQSLRLLLNLREEGRADLTLILVGRTELLARLQRVAALDQRVVVRTSLQPLPMEEVLLYVRRRLEQAGRDGWLIGDDAARPLWELSQGIPRRINQLCDLALLIGYADSRQSIGGVDIEAAAEELLTVPAAA